MKIVAECYKNSEFSERHLKNDTLERADGKALGTGRTLTVHQSKEYELVSQILSWVGGCGSNLVLWFASCGHSLQGEMKVKGFCNGLCRRWY
jgi:hypothetical protein